MPIHVLPLVSVMRTIIGAPRARTERLVGAAAVAVEAMHRAVPIAVSRKLGIDVT